MPRINTRAIAKLEEAQKALKKLGRKFDTTPGQALAADLIATLKTGKLAVFTIGDEQMTFTPDDVRVSRTTVMIGKTYIPLGGIRRDDDGDYTLCTLVDDVNLLGEDQKIKIARQEYAVAA